MDPIGLQQGPLKGCRCCHDQGRVCQPVFPTSPSPCWNCIVQEVHCKGYDLDFQATTSEIREIAPLPLNRLRTTRPTSLHRHGSKQIRPDPSNNINFITSQHPTVNSPMHRSNTNEHPFNFPFERPPSSPSTSSDASGSVSMIQQESTILTYRMRLPQCRRASPEPPLKKRRRKNKGPVTGYRF